MEFDGRNISTNKLCDVVRSDVFTKSFEQFVWLSCL